MPHDNLLDIALRALESMSSRLGDSLSNDEREAINVIRSALAEHTPPDELAINSWKLRFVYFDVDGYAVMCREPEVYEIQDTLSAMTNPSKQ